VLQANSIGDLRGRSLWVSPHAGSGFHVRWPHCDHQAEIAPIAILRLARTREISRQSRRSGAAGVIFFCAALAIKLFAKLIVQGTEEVAAHTGA
jgi:hypothetical protein